MHFSTIIKMCLALSVNVLAQPYAPGEDLCSLMNGMDCDGRIFSAFCCDENTLQYCGCVDDPTDIDGGCPPHGQVETADCSPYSCTQTDDGSDATCGPPSR